jgi:hypothetical protein
MRRYRKKALSDHLRQRLAQDYREDILRLGDLIGRDLSGWLIPARRSSGLSR